MSNTDFEKRAIFFRYLVKTATGVSNVGKTALIFQVSVLESLQAERPRPSGISVYQTRDTPKLPIQLPKQGSGVDP